jgi:hypothetical protein
VGRPERRRDLQDEGHREQRSQAAAASHGEASDQETPAVLGRASLPLLRKRVPLTTASR